MPDEKVIWWDNPGQGLILTRRDVVLIPFGLFFLGFSLFLETMAFTSGAPWFFALFGIPFVVVGLFLAVGRFFVDSWLRGRTLYAITDRRVLIARTPPLARLQALGPSECQGAEFEERADGGGAAGLTGHTHNATM